LQEKKYDVGPVELSVLEAGPENGSPVLFLHGIPVRGDLWKDVVPHFVDKGYRVFVPDFPGYGNTNVTESLDHYPSDENPYSLKGAANVLADWWSDRVAQIFACDHSKHLSHLTLSNCIASDKWPVFPVWLLKQTAALGMYPISALTGGVNNPYTHWELRKSVVNRKVMTKQVIEDLVLSDKVRTKRGRSEFAEHLKALSSKQLKSYDTKLGSISCPTLLAWATGDVNQPWDPIGTHLLNKMPDADIVHLVDAGHFFQLEKPAQYAEKLMNWHSRRKASNQNQGKQAA